MKPLYMVDAKHRSSYLLLGFLLIVTLLAVPQSSRAASEVFWQESFETDGNGTRYTTGTLEFTDGDYDYFLRTDGSDIGSGVSFQGSPDGSYFFAAQDVDGEDGPVPVDITFNPIDITRCTVFTFKGLFAEDDASDGNSDWDASDYVHVDYRIDGGSWTSLFWLENDGSTFNSAPFVDTDFDGTGDGTELTDTFTEFSVDIAGSGNSLELRITISLNAEDEDIVFDDLRVEGEVITVDGLDTGDWGTINPTVTDPSGDETTLPQNPGQDITAVYIAYSDTAVYFRVDTVGTPAQSSIDFYVDHGGSGACPEDAGHGSGDRYNWHLNAYYESGAWLTRARDCGGTDWGGFASNGTTVVGDIVEIAIPFDGEDPGAVYLFVRYGDSTDYAPNAGSDPVTLIDLASFNATVNEDGVLVAWTTASEIDNAGFNLYRSQSPEGEWLRLNDALIPAQGGPTQGAAYSFLDEGTTGGYYRLEDVDTSGVSTFHGPVSVGAPTAVGLLSLRASALTASALTVNAPVALLVIPLLALSAGALALVRRGRR